MRRFRRWWNSEQNIRRRYAIALWIYVCGNATKHTEPRQPFEWFLHAYDQRKKNEQGGE